MAPHYYSLQLELCLPLTESKHWNSPYSPIYLMFDQLRIIRPTFLASQPLSRDSLGCHVAMPQSLLSNLIIPYSEANRKGEGGNIIYTSHVDSHPQKNTNAERERDQWYLHVLEWIGGFFARPPHASIVSICKGRIKNRERGKKKRGGGGSKKCRKNYTFEKHSPVILASNIFWRHYFLFIGKLGI